MKQPKYNWSFINGLPAIPSHSLAVKRQNDVAVETMVLNSSIILIVCNCETTKPKTACLMPNTNSQQYLDTTIKIVVVVAAALFGDT